MARTRKRRKVAASKRMNKAEFCQQFAKMFKERGVSTNKAYEWLTAFGEALEQLLKWKGGPTVISWGFVKFKKSNVKARTYIVPSTGRKVRGKARKTVRASVAPRLRKAAKNN